MESSDTEKEDQVARGTADAPAARFSSGRLSAGRLGADEIKKPATRATAAAGYTRKRKELCRGTGGSPGYEREWGSAPRTGWGRLSVLPVWRRVVATGRANDPVMCEPYIRYSAPTLHHGRGLSPRRATSYSIITLPRIPCTRGATGAGPSPRSSERFRSPRRHRRAGAATRLAFPRGPNRVVATRSAAPATGRCGPPARRGS